MYVSFHSLQITVPIIFSGSCVCDQGFGGYDCSIDLTLPPIVFFAGEDGLCNTLTTNCKSIRIRGDKFIESTELICYLQQLQV